MIDYDDVEEALRDIAEERIPTKMEGDSDEIRFWQQDVALRALPLARQLIEENERLKTEHAAFRERVEANTDRLWGTVPGIADLQARLSAAEEDRDGWRRQAQFEDRKRADLQARLSDSQKAVAILGHQRDDLQARLSAAEQERDADWRKFVALRTRDEQLRMLGDRLSAAEEDVRLARFAAHDLAAENKRLKADAVTNECNCATAHVDESIYAAEKDAEHSEERAELHYRWYSESEAKLRRAEEVVEAAKKHNRPIHSQDLSDAIRRYEESRAQEE